MRRIVVAIAILGLVGFSLGSYVLLNGSWGQAYGSYSPTTVPTIAPFTEVTSSTSPSTTTSTTTTMTVRPSPFFSLAFLIELLPVLLVLVLISVIAVLVLRLRRSSPESTDSQAKKTNSESQQLKQRLETLGNRLDEIALFMEQSLSLQAVVLREVVVEGYERLDEALKDFASLSRPAHLTPFEYATTHQQAFSILNQEALVQVVTQFYQAAYREREPTQPDVRQLVDLTRRLIPPEHRSLRPTWRGKP